MAAKDVLDVLAVAGDFPMIIQTVNNRNRYLIDGPSNKILKMRSTETMKTFTEEKQGNDCIIKNHYMYVEDRRVVIQATIYSDVPDVHVSTWNHPDGNLPDAVRSWFKNDDLKIAIVDSVTIELENKTWVKPLGEHSLN